MSVAANPETAQNLRPTSRFQSSYRKINVRKELESVGNVLKITSGHGFDLASACVNTGLVVREDVQTAQAEAGHPQNLGDVLLSRGLLSENELGLFSALQRFQAGEAPTADDLRLGDILLRIGRISHEALSAALESQRSTRDFLGQELIKAGQATPADIEHGLAVQKKLASAWAALVAAALLAGSVEAQAGSSGMLAVSAVVVPNARMQVMRQAPTLVITAADIRRGYIDIPHASVLAVIATSGSGYSIDFLPRSEVFSAVRISGFEGEVALGAEGGTVFQRAMRSQPLALDYRFYLAPGVAAGEYAWPLAMAIRAS